MSKSKPYSALPVNHVSPEQLTQGRQGLDLTVGFDIGKFESRAVPRWADAAFGRPWRVRNPSQIPALIGLLRRLAEGRRLRLALEPSGTYGDALRQACHDAGLEVWRVNPKAAHDYAEIFDGVPSQHDGKDAAVVAELAALGKASLWPYTTAPEWEQELTCWVDWLEAQRQTLVVWLGRLEALLARHWPEATRVLKLTSATLLRALAHYGSPQAMAADAQAATRLAAWGGRWLDAAKVQQLLATAGSSSGIRPGPAQTRQLRRYAALALRAWRARHRARRALARLVRGREVLQAQARVVGGATACVLWACVGDPRDYSCGQAYRKAMGLNLTERSSGTSQGKLHISKRGQPQARRWLYLAALRLVKKAGVRGWYQAKTAGDAAPAKRVLVGLMRKLAVALYQVGAKGVSFEVRRLFAAPASLAAGQSSAGDGGVQAGSERRR
jgi:transposase